MANTLDPMDLKQKLEKEELHFQGDKNNVFQLQEQSLRTQNS